jgi:D-glycero-alpha-D-manno-heptose-7-phosphate kinase
MIRQVLLNREIKGQIEIISIADVPGTGTGLGSSSALAVGLLNSMYTYQGKKRTEMELAEEACDLEIRQLGKPIGKQDQYAAALGGLRYIRFEKTGKVVSQKVKISEATRKDLEYSLISFYVPYQKETSIQPARDGDSILADQNSRLSDNLKALSEMRDQATEGKKYLEAGDLESFGRLLNKAWILKRSLSSKISNPRIDSYYELGMKCGALGGKLSGAGGSGFLTFFCPRESQQRLRDAFKDLEEMNMRLEESGTKIIYRD